ncbi:3' terminal RNA ribose 2'-O-methyltransferase Hen1 [Tahibacter amnicola]|uniref:Small RNA 2'-O-methyltransferase n=1 Tax=Tahibacter amnicola TaxID=2976241 RepID=A0ABY6BHP1_9GAMM|nr:3' terminal RNA ribose 2'-O-methyltransferase Hen1 [Tahibacter amnicola]UXI68126.1 3' terminal RNA ribose 2'-O-methyltransferase Hen1 [Tahibacter amnicola]
MLITIATRHSPATDLGYLLSKHPDRLNQFELAFGKASVFFPHASHDYCQVCLLLEIDPVSLVRGSTNEGGPLAQYVNDRPYAASSFLAVALARVFSTAMNGECKGRPELAATEIAFEIDVPVLRSRTGEAAIRRCFEPLGYTVHADALGETPVNDSPASYFRLRMTGTQRISALLQHLYVLLPAIDGDKHYYIGNDEVDKLLAKASGWLPSHPEREWITQRFLKRQRSLVRAALAQLLESDEDDVETQEQTREAREEGIERPLSLNEQRIGTVLATLRAVGAGSVLDLGCGEGRLLEALLDDSRFTRIAGADVSLRVLERAADRLKLERMAPRKRERLSLWQGSLTYRDARFAGFDAACAVEVIEHMDLPRLDAFESVVFAHARPSTVVITTPNREYNVKFETLPAGQMRHPDHRFEWDRETFRHWAGCVAQRHGYHVEFLPIGADDPVVGAPTQMGVFRR